MLRWDSDPLCIALANYSRKARVYKFWSGKGSFVPASTACMQPISFDTLCGAQSAKQARLAMREAYIGSEKMRWTAHSRLGQEKKDRCTARTSAQLT